MSSVERSPRVFISATSGDLKSLRLVVKDALLKIGCMPVEQSDFPPDYRTVKDFLTSEIGKCDALLHFVGHRYGSEPDPNTLPSGEERRSYTQLEYEIARKLKKKVYTFICAEEFPFDDAAPEPEHKQLLQVAHRARLMVQSEMRNRIASATTCTEQILQLRLQLEELAKKVDAERRMQLISLSSVGVALLVVLLLLLFLLQLSGNTRDIAKEVAGDTKTLSEQTKGAISSVDLKIASMLKSDTLNLIAAKANIDPLAVKQSILQAQRFEIPALDYAQNLAAEGRLEESFGLARFITETALSEEPVDIPSAVEALRLAADDTIEITRRKGGAFDLVRGQCEAAKHLADRGLDLLRSHKTPLSSHAERQKIQVETSRAWALYYQSLYANADLAAKSLQDAIEDLSSAARIANQPVFLQSQLHHIHAYLHTESSKYGTTLHALAELENALKASDEMVRIANNHDDPQTKLKAYLARMNARILFADLQPQVAAIKTLELLAQDALKCNSIAEEVDGRIQSELVALEAVATFESARLAISETDRNRLLDLAMEKLSRAAQFARDAEHRPAMKIALRGLVRAAAMKGDREAMKNAFEQLMLRKMGFDRSRDLDYVFDYVDKFEPIDVVQAVVELLEKEVADCPFNKMPRLHGELSLLQARLLVRSRRIARFTPEDGYTFPDLQRARKILKNRLFPLAGMKGEERTLANAYELYGVTSTWGDFGAASEGIPYFEKALALLSREQDPTRWAEVERRLAK